MLWTATNCLALNPGKTELLWISTPRKAHPLDHSLFTIGDAVIVPFTEARLLGVLLDDSLSFAGQVSSVTRVSYFQLRKIDEIRRYISTSAAFHVVRTLVLSRLDYCKSIFMGLPEYQLDRLQLVMSAAARLIFGVRWKDRVTQILRDRLH